MKNREDSRIREFRAAVKSTSIGLQVGGTVLFGVAWALADPAYQYDASPLLVLSCLLLASICASWLIYLTPFSISTIWLLSIAFVILMEPSVDRPFWAMSLSIAISLVVAPIFPRLQEYLLIVSCVWLIFGKGSVLKAPHGGDEWWVWLLMLSILALGAFLNILFAKLHRESMGLRLELEKKAYTDALTGVPNRRKFMEVVQQLHASGKLDAGSFLMIDVDNFKSINDEHGHAQGDIVLQELAGVIRARTADDLFGRLGGEEFGVMLTTGSEERAIEVANQILRDVRLLNSIGKPITVSIGIANARNNQSVSDLMREADSALYVAKRNGKDRFSYVERL